MHNNREVWRRNLVRIFLALKEGTPLSKNELCQRLELSRPTVDRAVTHLLKNELAHQNGQGASAGGRRATLYTINPRALYTVGSDLEFPELNLVILGLNGDFIHKKSLSIPEGLTSDPTATLSFAATSIKALLTDADIPIARVAGIGVGIPAFLTGDTITVAGHTLPFWEHIPARRILADILSVPVFVNNDVKFMSLAEHRAMGYHDRVMAYLALRRGLKGDIRMGSSILIDGELFHGGNGNAGSLYHAYVEAREIQQYEKASPNLAAKFLADRLFEPIIHLLYLFDPNRVVINGAILGDGEKTFARALSNRLDNVHYEGVTRNLTVTTAQAQKLSCAKGGALFALEKALEQPASLITQQNKGGGSNKQNPSSKNKNYGGGS